MPTNAKNTFAVSDLSDYLKAGHSNLFTVNKGMVTGLKPASEPACMLTMAGIAKRDDLMCLLEVVKALGLIAHEQYAFFAQAYKDNESKKDALLGAWAYGDWSRVKSLESAGLSGVNQAVIESAADLIYAGPDFRTALMNMFGGFEVGDFAMVRRGLNWDLATIVTSLMAGETYTWRIIHDRAQAEKHLPADDRAAFTTASEWDRAALNGVDRTLRLTHDGKEFDYSWHATAVKGVGADNGRLNRKSRIIFRLDNGHLMAVNLTGPANNTISRIG